MAEEFEFAFGVVDEPIDVRDYHIAGVSAKEAETFPETYEIETSPVKNQGRVGSCVAHALSTAVEHFHKEQEGEDVKFSTGFIYGNRIISNEKLYLTSGQ